MFLSAYQLEQLTGRRQPRAQIRWLQHHGWPHEVRADGRPVVSEREVDRRLSTSSSSSARQEPNFAALEDLG